MMDAKPKLIENKTGKGLLRGSKVIAKEKSNSRLLSIGKTSSEKMKKSVPTKTKSSKKSVGKEKSDKSLPKNANANANIKGIIFDQKGKKQEVTFPKKSTGPVLEARQVMAKTNIATGGLAKSKSNESKKTVTKQASETSSNKKLMKLKQKITKLKEPKDKQPHVSDAASKAATIFVGNLPINTKRWQLVNIFKDFGPVNSIRLRTAAGKRIFKHKQRLEAGSLNAYVVLKDAAAAEKALSLNGVLFKTNHLRVTRSDINEHNKNHVDPKRTVFVGNLKYGVNEEKLRDIFSSCGEIEYVRRLLGQEKGGKGVAYVCFKSPDAVGLALELKNTLLDDRPINIERYSVQKLGAKVARDAKNVKFSKSKKDGKQKLHGKNEKTKTKSAAPLSTDKKLKKSKYHGVKVNTLKKKVTKKIPNSHMKRLAKKIAPKLKT